MLQTILIIVAILIAVILIYAATRPNSFHVERTTHINAQPESIYPLIEDFRRWGPWSPYEKMDPDMKRSFSGTASGKGSVYAFEGNAKVGAGRLEIIETREPSLVRITLDMIKPVKGHNVINFMLQPKGSGTDVTWAMDGNSPYIAKVMGLFLNMDRMIGTAFEQGLAGLKAQTEPR